jgi:hypothetical protein
MQNLSLIAAVRYSTGRQSSRKILNFSFRAAVSIRSSYDASETSLSLLAQKVE